MSAPFFNILSKCDRALVAFLIEAGVGSAQDTVPGKRSNAKELPLTIVSSENYLLIRNTGVCTIKTLVMMKSIAAVDTTQDPAVPKLYSDARTATVTDAFWNAGDRGDLFDSKQIASAVTAAARTLAQASANDFDMADFTALDVRIVGGEAGYSGDGAAWIDTLELEIDCTPYDVT